MRVLAADARNRSGDLLNCCIEVLRQAERFANGPHGSVSGV